VPEGVHDQTKATVLPKNPPREIYRYLTIRPDVRERVHLVRERVRCGKPGCCARGPKHGPYWYLRYEYWDAAAERAATLGSMSRGPNCLEFAAGSAGPEQKPRSAGARQVLSGAFSRPSRKRG